MLLFGGIVEGNLRWVALTFVAPFPFNCNTPVPLCNTLATHTHAYTPPHTHRNWTKKPQLHQRFLPSHLAHFWCWIKKDKMRERGAGKQREQSGLPNPVKGSLCWTLLSQHTHKHTPTHTPPRTHTHTRTHMPLCIHPSHPLLSLPPKAWVDFSLNAIRNVTSPIHGLMEGLAVRLQNDRNPGCSEALGTWQTRE